MSLPDSMPPNPPGHFFLIHEDDDGRIEAELRKEHPIFGHRFSKRVTRAVMPEGSNIRHRDGKVIHVALQALAKAHSKGLLPPTR